jgi:flagella basal body P-ring formation protein FlgA
VTRASTTSPRREPERAGRWLPIGLAALLAAAAADPPPVPGPLAGRVAETIAATWRVPPVDLRLDWRGPGSGRPLAADVPFHLAGRGDGGWFVVVFEPAGEPPVALRVRAGVEDTVAVAARPLAAGARVASGDLVSERRLRWGPPAADPGARPGVGWEIRRPLASGEVVAWPAATPPPWVAGGEPVRLVWERGTVAISMMGTALHSARRGETVRARVEGRPGPLAGRVTEPGIAVLEGASR